MNDIQNILVTFSIISWIGIIIYDLSRNGKKKLLSFAGQIFIIVIISVVLNRYFAFFETKEFKGGLAISEVWILLGLYISTILGMLGHHVFIQINDIKDKDCQRKIKWIPVIKPLIISPIIFLSVLNQIEQLSPNSNTIKIVIMQFIFAFQNGFFWKTIIEKLENKKDVS